MIYILDMNHGLYSLHEIAAYYNFPSIKILRKLLKNYYKIELKKDFSCNYVFSQKEKEEMLDLYVNKNYSLSKLSADYLVSTYKIINTLREFPEFSMKYDLKTKPDNLDVTYDEKERIIGDVVNGRTLTYVRQKYSLTDSKLKKILKSDVRGREVLYRNMHLNYIEIPIEEIAKAYQNNDFKSVMDKYDISEAALRNRLIKYYGADYTRILKKQADDKDMKERLAALYENGMTCTEIAKQENLSKQKVTELINQYYRRKKIEKPKIFSKEAFKELIDKGKSLEEAIQQVEKAGYKIPESYIDEQYKKQGEINIKKIKDIVLKQLADIGKEGKKPNLISPFELPNYLKEKGYGNKYYATALLYRVIVENELSTQILETIDNDEICEAVELLTTSNQEQNELASTIHKEEKELLESKNKEKEIGD